MATWPITLPQCPLIEGYKRTPQDSVIKFSTDTGAAKERNRATAMPDTVTEMYVLEPAQRDILYNFYKGAAGRGTIPFFKSEPETGLIREYKFSSPPSFDRIGLLYKATCNMELLP